MFPRKKNTKSNIRNQIKECKYPDFSCCSRLKTHKYKHKVFHRQNKKAGVCGRERKKIKTRSQQQIKNNIFKKGKFWTSKEIQKQKNNKQTKSRKIRNYLVTKLYYRF